MEEGGGDDPMSISKLVFINVEKVRLTATKTTTSDEMFISFGSWSPFPTHPQSMPPSVHGAQYELKVGHL